MKYSFENIVEILSTDSYGKSASVLVSLAGGVKGVVVLEKLAWDSNSIEESLASLFKSSGLNLKFAASSEDSNDCYYRYSNGSSRITLIAPASDAMILKHRFSSRKMIAETPSLYASISGPFWHSLPLSDLKWIENALNGTAEADSVVARVPNWLILPDLKWAPRDPRNLYLVALLEAPLGSLRTIRDLTSDHLPMLKAFKQDISKVLLEAYEMALDQVRIYFHYPPTYHHLHLHVVATSVERPQGTAVGLAHLLDDVIENIEFDTCYYQTRTINMCIASDHALYRAILRQP